jgi:hypothetical protein
LAMPFLRCRSLPTTPRQAFHLPGISTKPLLPAHDRKHGAPHRTSVKSWPCSLLDTPSTGRGKAVLHVVMGRSANGSSHSGLRDLFAQSRVSMRLVGEFVFFSLRYRGEVRTGGALQHRLQFACMQRVCESLLGWSGAWKGR